MFAESLRLARFLLKAFPAVMLVVFGVLPIWDWIYPWETAREALAPYGRQLRLCVGRPSYSSAGEPAVLHRQGSYLLLPRVLVSPELITVDETVSDGGQKREVDVSRSPGRLLLLLSFLGSCVWLTLRWWVDPFGGVVVKGFGLPQNADSPVSSRPITSSWIVSVPS
jgi:hypothetical protein